MNKRFSLITLFIFLVSCIIFSSCSANKNTKENASETSNIDYLVLVNKQNKLPDNWEDIVQLEKVSDVYNDDCYVEKEVLEKYNELREALLRENVTIELDSCYRSVSAQEQIVKDFTEKYGEDYVKKYVAVPGYSEHHTGLAIDICIIKDGELVNENDDMIAQREVFAKIHEKLPKYGFILRYLEGKDEITGYAYEPWHLRYVGSEKIAKDITSRGITLEEYLGK